MTTVTPIGEPPAGLVILEAKFVSDDPSHISVKWDTPAGIKYSHMLTDEAGVTNPLLWEDTYLQMAIFTGLHR